MLPKIRTISLHQWFASAVALGLKHNETRHWPTEYRGPLAIHAAARPFRWRDVPRDVVKAFAAAGLPEGTDLPRGRIIAVTNIVDVIEITTDLVRKLTASDRVEMLCGNYGAGRFAWALRDTVRLEKPIPEVGRQRFWHWQPPEDFELAPVASGAGFRKWVRR